MEAAVAAPAAAPSAITSVDNGDGTATLTFQPGPGLNTGTDAGTENAGKDVSVLYNGGFSNYGNSGWLHHFSSNCNAFQAVSLYRFDLGGLPDPSTVVSVQMALYHTFIRSYYWGWQTASTQFALYPVLAPWNEMTLQYSNLPLTGSAVATTSVPTLTTPRTIDTGWGTQVMAEGWGQMDITSLYLAWKSGQVANNGVMYRRQNVWCENANATYTASSDMQTDPTGILPTSSAWRPKLLIRYRTSPPNRPPSVWINGATTQRPGWGFSLNANGTDPDGDALTYAWKIDGVAAAPTQMIFLRFDTPGTHLAQVTVTDEHGLSASASHQFQIVNSAPTVNLQQLGPAYEGSPTALRAVGYDADNDPLTYQWTFEDGWRASGPVVQRNYPDNGTHSATVLVTDGFGGSATATISVVVQNVPPSVSARFDTERLVGEVAQGYGGFGEPGYDTWTGVATYGDGAAEVLALGPDHLFVLSHRYTQSGTFAWRVTITDDDGGAGSYGGSILVVSFGDWLNRMIAKVKGAQLEKGLTNSLVVKLENAVKSLEKNNRDAALGQLGAFENELDAATRTGRFPTTLSQELTGMLARLLAVL